jgi:hypothetical protein
MELEEIAEPDWLAEEAQAQRLEPEHEPTEWAGDYPTWRDDEVPVWVDAYEL